MRILVVEDDEILLKNISIILKRASYAVDTAKDVDEASNKLASMEYDLVLMDWKLPDGNGIDLCKETRKNNPEVKIIMLTANSQVEDKIEGLDAGADDYITKPFEMDELLARIRSALRRSGLSTLKMIIIDDLQIDTALRIVKRGGKEIALSTKEYALLEYLALNEGMAVSRVDLLSHVWDENANIFSNTVDVHIRYLRNKIDKGRITKLIRTIKGKGYAIARVD
ncbi:response regulator transcription factor [Candidatus Shapirobacteria bacterium]|nr:response regulator transcription factor [Candidatus Shapirobacteria bacterium]